MTEDFPQINIKEKITKEDLLNYSKEQLVDKIVKQKHKIDELFKAKDPTNLKEVIEKLKLQLNESNRRQNYLLYSVSRKEQENQELATQLQELKTPSPTSTQLQVLLLDPAINLMFQQMKSEVDQLKLKLDQAQKDLAAWKFTPDSQAGKRLMARCRMLLQENEEQARIIATGRIAKLEGEIAMQKKLIEEMKKNSNETEEFIAEMDEDTEANQATIYLLKQELKETKEQLIQDLPQCKDSINFDNPQNASLNHDLMDSTMKVESIKMEIIDIQQHELGKVIEEESVDQRTKNDGDLISENHKTVNQDSAEADTLAEEKQEVNNTEVKRLSVDPAIIKTPKRDKENGNKPKGRTNKSEEDQKLRVAVEKFPDDHKVKTNDRLNDDFKNSSRTGDRDKQVDDTKAPSRTSDKNDSSRTKSDYKRTEDYSKEKDRHEQRTKNDKYRKEDEKYRTKDRKRSSVGRSNNSDEMRTTKDSKDTTHLNGISKVRIISTGQTKH